MKLGLVVIVVLGVLGLAWLVITSQAGNIDDSPGVPFAQTSIPGHSNNPTAKPELIVSNSTKLSDVKTPKATLKALTVACAEISIPKMNCIRSRIKYPGADPSKAPRGYVWRGKPGTKPGGKQGAWYNPKTGESLHPDLTHKGPIGPHWDYIDTAGKKWRIYPDGRMEPK